MTRLFKQSVEDVILCEACLAEHEVPAAAELLPRFFPGTYGRLSCARCGTTGGAAPAPKEAAAE